MANNLTEKDIKLCPNGEVGSYKLANDIFGFIPMQCKKEGKEEYENGLAALKILKGNTIVVPNCAKRIWYHPFQILKPEPCLKYRTNEAYIYKLFTKQHNESTKCYSKWNPDILLEEGNKISEGLDHNNLQPNTNTNANIKGVRFF
jgi:hypothetical protein